MKNIGSKTIIFILTVSLGFLIAGKFSFQGFNDSLKLNTAQYQDAIEKKNKLLKEIGSLKSDNAKAQEKIEKYTNEGVNSEKVVEDMKSELEQLNMMTGFDEVSGEGIVIIVNDGVFDNDLDSQQDLLRKTLHDADMFAILNELKSVGAEAISINEHRFTPLSALTCKYAFLEFEDSDMVSAPFNIYAIGDAETMKSLMLEDGSYLKRLQSRGLSVELEVKENIVMKASTTREMKYAKEFIKNN